MIGLKLPTITMPPGPYTTQWDTTKRRLPAGSQATVDFMAPSMDLAGNGPKTPQELRQLHLFNDVADEVFEDADWRAIALNLFRGGGYRRVPIHNRRERRTRPSRRKAGVAQHNVSSAQC